MDRSNVCLLVSVEYQQDSIGQPVAIETLKPAFCDIASVSRSEFYDAGRNGLKPEYRITIFAPDYHGEEALILNNIRYGVIRTYRNRNETVELYVERKTGEYGGASNQT